MKKFYIVDNNIVYSSSLESMLRNAKYEVSVNHGNTDLLNIAKDIAYWQPDFIITDIVFPELDGLSLVHYLQENPETNFLPLAAYTLSCNRHLMEKSFEKGVDHFFIKEDFPPQTLLKRLFKLYKLSF